MSSKFICDAHLSLLCVFAPITVALIRRIALLCVDLDYVVSGGAVIPMPGVSIKLVVMLVDLFLQAPKIS